MLPGVFPPVTYLGSLAHFLVAGRTANVVPKKVLLVQLRLLITAQFEPSSFMGFRGAQMVRNGSDFDLLASSRCKIEDLSSTKKSSRTTTIFCVSFPNYCHQKSINRHMS